MPVVKKPIPVNVIIDDPHTGIMIERISFPDICNADETTLIFFEEGKQSHRHDTYSFYLLEAGTVSIEIDFQKYKIKPSSVIYIHPDQVHRTTSFDNITVSSWAIHNENLNPDYLTLLEEIRPAKPLVLQKDIFSLVSEAVSLCLKLSERKNDKLYHSLLKDSCNALTALVLSQYLEQATPTDRLSRFETVTRTFRKLLERNYTTTKRPADYARQLNISTPYLNECVKNTTGYSVSYHIQQRVVLEAKRLLCYSDKPVKEIAAHLGYDDYPYFSRMFTKATGASALAFRNKNHV